MTIVQSRKFLNFNAFYLHGYGISTFMSVCSSVYAHASVHPKSISKSCSHLTSHKLLQIKVALYVMRVNMCNLSHYQIPWGPLGKEKPTQLSVSSPPCVSPKKFCGLAQIGSTLEAGTSQ